jgi:hypothetical protein
MEKWGRNGRTAARGMQKTDTNCCTYENSFVRHRDCCLLHLFCFLLVVRVNSIRLSKRLFFLSFVSFVILLNVYGSDQLFCQIPFALAG